eukprot:gene31375-40400_t
MQLTFLSEERPASPSRLRVCAKALLTRAETSRLPIWLSLT